MPHVIYIHIPYIILHLNVHIQYHIYIHVFVFARRRKAARIAKAAGFVLYVHCPLNPWAKSWSSHSTPYQTAINCRKGEGSGWAQGKAEEQGPRGSASCLIARSPDRHCSVFTSFHIHGRLRRSILTSTRRPLKYVEMVWNGMKVTTWHLRWHLRCFAASSINNSPFASRGSGSLGSVLRWIYVAQPQLSGDAGSGSSCAPFGFEGRRLGDVGHHRTTWQGKTWDSDTSTDSFRIKIFSRYFQDLQAV